MEIKYLNAPTVTLSHPPAGAQSLPIHHRLRALKLTEAERKQFADVSARVHNLHAQAAAYGAERLEADLEAAKAEIRENITEEGLERVARLSALAADQQVRRRVEAEANQAVAPAIAAADAELIPVCLRLVEAVRAQFEASAAAFDLKPLSEFIGQGELDGVSQYVTERLDATRRALDALASKARDQTGCLALLRDDAQISC
jgi:hypothetical protein